MTTGLKKSQTKKKKAKRRVLGVLNLGEVMSDVGTSGLFCEFWRKSSIK